MPILAIKKHRKSKKNISKKLSIFFVFFVVILFFLVIVNISDLFSSLITNKNSLFFTQKIEIPSYCVYGVSINDFNNFEDAEECALYVQQQGGAGIVYESGEKFVFTSAYPTLIEAKEINENLLELGYKSRIVNLKVDGILKDYKGENCNALTQALNYFRVGFLELYETTIKIDKNELTQTQVNSVLAKLLTKANTIQTQINSYKQEQDLAIKQIISVPLEQIESELEDVLYFVGDDLIYTSKLKQLYISFVLKNKEIVSQINSL